MPRQLSSSPRPPHLREAIESHHLVKIPRAVVTEAHMPVAHPSLLETLPSDVPDIMICSCKISTALLYTGMMYRLRSLRKPADEPGYGFTGGCCCGVHVCICPAIFAVLRMVQKGGGGAVQSALRCVHNTQLQFSFDRQTTLYNNTADHSQASQYLIKEH